MKETKELTGIYQASGRGFGFLIPEEGEDCFIPPRANGGAWNGDKVTACITEEDPEAGRRVAKVVQVLERANKTVTGVLERQDHALWLKPDNDRLPGPIQVFTKRKGVRPGERAAVAMTSFGGGKTAPMGTLRERFGPADRRESAVEAILYTHDIVRTFPPAVLAETETIPQAVESSALAGRLDLRGKTIITIDGASSKDFDDAVSLEKDDQGRWVLGVHIADVSHYVRPGSPLDLEVALTDPLGYTAQGLETIHHQGNDKIILKRLEEILQKYEIGTFVIGMPVNMDGTKTERVEVTEKFIHKLRCKFPKIKVETIDERLTTVAAHRTMNLLEIDGKKKKNIVDTISAVYILETYMKKQENKEEK